MALTNKEKTLLKKLIDSKLSQYNVDEEVKTLFFLVAQMTEAQVQTKIEEFRVEKIAELTAQLEQINESIQTFQDQLDWLNT